MQASRSDAKIMIEYIGQQLPFLELDPFRSKTLEAVSIIYLPIDNYIILILLYLFIYEFWIIVSLV